MFVGKEKIGKNKMDFTFAKIKNENYELLLNRGVFLVPNLSDSVEYSSVLENTSGEEWFFIENYSQQKYAIKDLPQESTSLNYISKINFTKISFIVSSVEGNYLCFQKVTKQQIIKKKAISFSNDRPELKEEPNLFIQQEPHAVYEKDTDRLYFKNIKSLFTLFKGIEELYRMASEEEVKKFLNNPLIKLDNNFNSSLVKNSNRYRIALIENNTLVKITNNRKKFIRYVAEYSAEMKCMEDQIIISSDQELKILLYGINERYFTTPFTREKFAARTIEKM